MRGNIIVEILVAIVQIALGWTLGQVFESYALFTLDWSIGVADVFAVLIELFLAIFIVKVIENSAQNQRVEKDFYISELNEVQQALSTIEKTCSSSGPLSFTQTVYDLEKSKKSLLGMWKIMGERNHGFRTAKNEDFKIIVEKIRLLNSQLTDTNFFNVVNGFEPVKITRGHIYLNKTVSSEIDKTFTEIKDLIFNMKISVNDM